MGIKLHPRHKQRVLAEVDLMKFLIDLNHKYDLSYGETIEILAKTIQREANHLKKMEDQINAKL